MSSPADVRWVRFFAIGLSCVAVGLSLVGRSRLWFHTTGRLHIWYHLLLFGVLGAFALRASSRPLWRVISLAVVIALGLGIEFSQSIGNHAAIEWDDVQMDCFGVVFGCLVFWLLPGKPQTSA